MIAGRLVGDAPPYADGSEAEIEPHLRRAVAALDRQRPLDAEGDFNHYGSGYASYVDVFCFKSGGRSTVRRDNVDWIDGLSLYLCRLAPVAAFGPGQKTRHDRGGGYTFLRPESVGETPDGDWTAETRALADVLGWYGFSVLSKEQLSAPLPFKAEVATILADPPYQVFDALFYWED